MWEKIIEYLGNEFTAKEILEIMVYLEEGEE